MNTTMKTGLLLAAILVASCGCTTLAYQIVPSIWYHLIDFRVVDDEVLVILEKERAKSEISLTRAMLGDEGGIAYRRRSISLLVFNANELNSLANTNISLKEKIDIVREKDVRGDIRIIDKNTVISGDDIISDKPFNPYTEPWHPSIIHLNNRIESRYIPGASIDFGKTISKANFNRNKFFYIADKRMFIFDVDTFETKEEIVSDFLKEKFSKAYAKPLSNDGNLFICHTYNGPQSAQQNGAEYQPYKFTIIDKKTNEVVGGFDSKMTSVLDFNEKNKMILLGGSSLGYEIVDINGNALYALNDKSLSFPARAVMHNDKVYAAKLSDTTGEFVDPSYIEFLVWDYKNNTVVGKRFPCDKANLDV